MNRSDLATKAAVVAFGVSLTLVGSVVVQAQSPGDRPIEPLTGKVPLGPSPDNYYAIVKDPASLVALGKALFWDTQVASANNQSCASCHFHAGADTRTMNQIDPGLRRATGADNSFGGEFNPVGGFANPAPGAGNTTMNNGRPAGPNIDLLPDDFPFHKLTPVRQADGSLSPTNREAVVTFDTNDIASSQGSFTGGPTTLEPTAVGQRTRCDATPSAPFAVTAGGTLLGTRRVEPRNTPTVINAAFNFRNFWDGRANNTFNGVSPFGLRDKDARVFKTDGSSVTAAPLALENMSAASQAVGPVTNDTEMTCQGKKFADVGRRLMQQRALQHQQVAANDSVFSTMPGGSIVSGGGGLQPNYRQLVQQAFQPAYWNNNQFFTYNPTTGAVVNGGGAANGYQIDELNFSMFFGLAVDAYERTLISDKTPFDVAGGRLDPTTSPGRGQALFVGQGSCISCHDGPLFSKATAFRETNPAKPTPDPFHPIEHMPMNSGPPSFYDHGFYNTGVRPAFEDVGVGASDPFGNPLSFTRQLLGTVIDTFKVYPCQFEIPFAPPPAACSQLPTSQNAGSQRVDIDAAFKTPGLRNVALTAPYMHNGGHKSLDEVMEFYNRGGDRRSVASTSPGTENDTTGTGPLGQTTPVVPGMGGSNVHLDIKPLGLNAGQRADLVNFMKALTDPRVACHAAPFDHPSLTVANGQLLQAANKGGNATDIPMTIPAVGAGGYSTCNSDALNTGELFSSRDAFNKLK